MKEQGSESRIGRRRGRLRLAGRCAALLIAVLLLADVVPGWGLPTIVPALSPWVAICSATALRSASWIVLLGLPVLLLARLRRRGFCRYACPVGLLTEQASRPSPWARGAYRKLPHLGRGILWIAIAGACVGYPLLLWLDPLAIFAGFFGVWRHPLGAASLLPAVGLPIVLVVSLFLPGAWCMRVCPLGSLQDLTARRRSALPAPAVSPATITISTPAAATRESITAPDSTASCPAASTVLAETADLPSRFSRRSLVAVGIGAAWAIVTLQFLRRRPSGPIRPPGAVAEEAFSGLCIRCGNCVRACPTGILHPDLGEHGTASWLTPLVRIEDDYCRETCHRCTQVCPSGAIQRLTLEEKRRARMGTAVVDLETCLVPNHRECRICVNLCPYEAIQIEWSEKEYTNLTVVDPAKCCGCGACESVCVTTPVKAIRIVPPSQDASAVQAPREPAAPNLSEQVPTA